MSGGQDEENKKLAWIPDEVQHIITDMACRPVHNGQESPNEARGVGLFPLARR